MEDERIATSRSPNGPASRRARGKGEERDGRRVAIAGGHTAGHVNTGLEIAREYRRCSGASSILFIGTPQGFEERLVPPTGHRVGIISAAPVVNRGPLGRLGGVWRAVPAYVQARRLLRAERIELVVGLGSYASGVTLLAAHRLGIRTALHEANARLGLANRIAARFVDRIYLGSPSALGGPQGSADGSTPVTAADRERVVVTGNPVRREIAECSHCASKPDPARPARILVIGGSRGSRFLNERAPELLGRLAARGIDLEVRHQSGDTDPTSIAADYERLGIDALVVPYFDDMAEQYAGAHFAVTSAGAISLAELAACGLPSLVVPLAGAARDHQVHNAVEYSRLCGALWTRRSTWDPSDLAAVIAQQLGDAALWSECSERTHKLFRPNAARRLVEDCEALMGAAHR